jgi:hypothetical protein
MTPLNGSEQEILSLVTARLLKMEEFLADAMTIITRSMNTLHARVNSIEEMIALVFQSPDSTNMIRASGAQRQLRR